MSIGRGPDFSDFRTRLGQNQKVFISLCDLTILGLGWAGHPDFRDFRTRLGQDQKVFISLCDLAVFGFSLAGPRFA